MKFVLKFNFKELFVNWLYVLSTYVYFWGVAALKFKIIIWYLQLRYLLVNTKYNTGMNLTAILVTLISKNIGTLISIIRNDTKR